MKKILYRLRQPMPPFFERSSQWLLTLIACLFAILLVPIALPAILIQAACFLLSACFGGWLICQLTVDTDAAFLRWINLESSRYHPDPFQFNLLK